MFRNINSKMIQNRSRALKHDYHTSAWDKFISKTQKVNDDLLKGHFTRSKQRDKDEVSSKRTMDPNYYDMGKSCPRTVKNSKNKSISFKPPLAPKNDVSGCPRYGIKLFQYKLLHLGGSLMSMKVV